MICIGFGGEYSVFGIYLAEYVFDHWGMIVVEDNVFLRMKNA